MARTLTRVVLEDGSPAWRDQAGNLVRVVRLPAGLSAPGTTVTVAGPGTELERS